VVRSGWLTAVRTRRLLTVLAALPARTPGIPDDQARLRVWRSCGGPIDEVPVMLDVLVGAELAVREHGQLRLSRGGQRVVAQHGPQGLRPLVLALLRAGYFHDQARILLELGRSQADGSLTCASGQARRACPQLVGALQHWPDVTSTQLLRVPAHLVRELEAVWALLPAPSPDEAALEAARKSIGDRGELYSYQLERLNAEVPSDIVWVARDDDNLGYDIEDRSVDPRRRIEVKASGDTVVRFFLSDNEWQKAHEDPSHYEIHFWGSVDLSVPPAEEFPRLRARSYPTVLRNLPELLHSGQLAATTYRWRIVQPSG
jgi:hypothetical protein